MVAKARQSTLASAAASKNRQMTTRERQHLHLQLNKMEEINNRHPGSVYAVETEVTSKSIKLRFVWNRDSIPDEVSARPTATDRAANAARAEAPARAPKAKTDGSKPKAHEPLAAEPTGTAARPEAAEAARPRPRAAAKARRIESAIGTPAVAASVVKADEAAALRDTIASCVGSAVRKLGGDSLTGDENLLPKQPLVLYNHKTRGIRLLKGSTAAEKSADEFSKVLEKIWDRARTLPRDSDRFAKAMKPLELLLATRLATDAMAVDTVADGLASVNVGRPTPSTGG